MKHIDLDINTINNLQRMFCGLDTFINSQLLTQSTSIQNYPPYNLYKVDDTTYVYEISVIGFDKDEIEVKTEKNSLLVIAKRKDKDDSGKQYILRHLAKRDFRFEAGLIPHTVIKSANIQNGILYVVANIILPDELKSRIIDIS